MKVLCDVHISFILVAFFKKNGIEAEHVNNFLNSFFTTDKAISEYADKHNIVIITKDIDFRNSYFINKSPQKLIRICLGNIPTATLIIIFESNLDFLKKLYQTTPKFYLEVFGINSLMLTS